MKEMKEGDKVHSHPDKIDHKSIFVERITALKGDKNLSNFASLCGMSEGGMRKYLQGASSPSLEKLSQIASANNVSIAWLIGEAISPKPLIERDINDKATSEADFGKKKEIMRMLNTLDNAELNDFINKLRRNGVASILRSEEEEQRLIRNKASELIIEMYVSSTESEKRRFPMTWVGKLIEFTYADWVERKAKNNKEGSNKE